jgi:hypothetical protein
VGGILDTYTNCVDAQSCYINLTETITATSCESDQFGNTCNEQCCLTGINSQAPVNVTLCSSNAYCQAISLKALTPANMIKYADKISSIFAIQSFSSSLSPGIKVAFILIGLLGLLLIIIRAITFWKFKKLISLEVVACHKSNEMVSKNEIIINI